RACTPGLNSTTRRIVPPANVVPTWRFAASSWPSLLTGNPSVVQIGATSAPGRPTFRSVTTSSILTIALPLASWPVITRRTLCAISRLPVVAPTLGGGAIRRKGGGFSPRHSMLRFRQTAGGNDEALGVRRSAGG